MPSKKLIKVKGLKIPEVEYSRLVTTYGYNNFRIGAKATVGPNESPGSVLEELMKWLDKYALQKQRMEYERKGERERSSRRILITNEGNS